jgi:hypothetical protein
VSRQDDARDAALWRAARDLTRIHGQLVMIDRHQDGALVAVGGERQTSDGVTLDDALSLAAHRVGLDAEPRTTTSPTTLPLTRDTIPTVPQYDSDEGGP